MIYNENCLETLGRLSDETIDLTVTSPPYDDLKTYNGFVFDYKPIIKELYRATKQGGVVVWIIGDATVKGNETGTSFEQALFFKEVGFNLHDTMIWRKTNVFNFGSNNCYRQSFEYMFVFSKGTPKSINLIKDLPAKSAGQVLKGARKHADGRRDTVPDFVVGEFKKRDNVWDQATSNASFGHPATFPEQLVVDHIVSWSNELDLVYDPFMGSGTTAVAAIKTNRNWFGSEISDEYVDSANRRIDQVKNKVG